MDLNQAIAIIKNTSDPLSAIEMAGAWKAKDFSSEIKCYEFLEEPEEGGENWLALIYAMRDNHALRSFLRSDENYDAVYDAIA